MAAFTAMTCPMLTPAAQGTGYSAVNGGTAVFEKYLVMDAEANVPDVTFEFAISAENVSQINSDGTGTVQVHPGNDKNRVQGEPVISTAEFTPNQKTYKSVQNEPSSVTVQNHTDGAGKADSDALTLNSGKKYARSDVTVDLKNVKFNEPGVYRYVISEKDADDTVTADAGLYMHNSDMGITNDSDKTRTLDVYVIDVNGSLQIQGYVLHNEEASAAVSRNTDSSVNPAGKSGGYVNDYETENLTIRKTVAGNQASRDEYFKFTLDIMGLPGTVYKVDLSNADLVTKGTGANDADRTAQAQGPQTYVNGISENTALRVTSSGLEAGTYTMDNDGSMTFTANADAGLIEDGKAVFWLQTGQSVTVDGIARNSSYTVCEDAARINEESYDPEAKVTGDTVTHSSHVVSGASSGSSAIVMDQTAYSVSDTNIQNDTIVAYTNTKSGMIPTGIMATVIPGAAAMVLGVAGIAAIKLWRRRKTGG